MCACDLPALPSPGAGGRGADSSGLLGLRLGASGCKVFVAGAPDVREMDGWMRRGWLRRGRCAAEEDTLEGIWSRSPVRPGANLRL